jgi:hypothetical protein
MREQTMRVRYGRHEWAVVGLVLCLLTLYDAAPHAQLAAPGPSGVVMGHLHLATKDVEASRRFWAALGGVAVQNGPLELIQLPGTFVMLRQSQQTAGGSEGSTVERVVLRVRTSEMPQLAQKLEQTTGSKFASALLTSPEGVTIELRGAASQEAAVQMERLVFKTVAPAETCDWPSSRLTPEWSRRRRTAACALPDPSDLEGRPKSRQNQLVSPTVLQSGPYRFFFFSSNRG